MHVRPEGTQVPTTTHKKSTRALTTTTLQVRATPAVPTYTHYGAFRHGAENHI